MTAAATARWKTACSCATTCTAPSNDDAIRRDFTCNALYYAIEDFSVRDYRGFEDVQARLMKLIGDPVQRYQEDPVRMLRAVRLAAKLGFQIEEGTAAPIRTWPACSTKPRQRLFEEVLKLFLSGHGVASFEALSVTACSTCCSRKAPRR